MLPSAEMRSLVELIRMDFERPKQESKTQRAQFPGLCLRSEAAEPGLHATLKECGDYAPLEAHG